MTLCDMPVIQHLSPKANVSADNQLIMRNWAKDFGKCVRQRTVRQETTKFKAGTLPLNMYKKSNVKPGEKILFQWNVPSVPQESAVNVEELEIQEGADLVGIEKVVINESSVPQEKTGNAEDLEIQEGADLVGIEEEVINEDNEEFEQLSEYDSESDDEEQHEIEDIEPIISTRSLDFMRAVTTRSGRSVKVSMKFR